MGDASIIGATWIWAPALFVHIPTNEFYRDAQLSKQPKPQTMKYIKELLYQQSNRMLKKLQQDN